MKKYKNIKRIILDMDGTLYRLSGQSSGFYGSNLDKTVVNNAISFVANKKSINKKESEKIILEGKKYNLGISWYLKNKLFIDRAEYFNKVWDINPNNIIEKFEYSPPVLQKLSSKFELILLTAAPKIWKDKITKYLSIESYFSRTFSGDSFKTKDKIFKLLANEDKPEYYLSIGDQIETDILPAQNLGMNAILVKNPSDLKTISKKLL